MKTTALVLKGILALTLLLIPELPAQYHPIEEDSNAIKNQQGNARLLGNSSNSKPGGRGGLLGGAGKRESGEGAATFTFLTNVPVGTLNKVLTTERDSFMENKTSSGYQIPSYQPARYSVDIYTVSYPTVIKEWSNKPTIATGMVAIPRGINPINLPVVSYQHGTVYGQYEVPSYCFRPDGAAPNNIPHYTSSYETRLVVAAFAGQGYAVIAADYIGLGDSTEPDGYGVRSLCQQACLDMYRASAPWITKKTGAQQVDLYLAGWSQGGMNTLSFIQKLESEKVPVKAVATAAAPCDQFTMISGYLFQPRAIDAEWKKAVVILSVFSYENYFKKPNLSKSVINKDYWETCKIIYDRNYKSTNEFNELMGSLPTDLHTLMIPSFTNQVDCENSEYGNLLNAMQVYKLSLSNSVTMFCGTADEVVSEDLGSLAMTYQKHMFKNKNISVVKVDGGNHRGTFLTMVMEAKTWFDTLKMP
jgi:pimeloyl-ACP methyl ester carboxylesterase